MAKGVRGQQPGVAELMDQAIAVRVSALGRALPTLEDADNQAHTAALDAIMQMHAQIHQFGQVALPAPAVRAQMQLSTAEPELRIDERATAAGYERRFVLGATSTRHATAYRKHLHKTARCAAPSPATGNNPTIVADMWSSAPLRAPRGALARPAPISAAGGVCGGGVRRPRDIDAAIDARRYAPPGGKSQRQTMPIVAVQRTLHVQRANREAARRPATRTLEHPLWTMPLHSAAANSDASRSGELRHSAVDSADAADAADGDGSATRPESAIEEGSESDASEEESRAETEARPMEGQLALEAMLDALDAGAIEV
jgi:hypothetical protein